MQAADLPARIPVPFADAGTKNAIPVTPGVTPGLASFQLGFPPLTMTPLASGGIPPAGDDFNGILNRLTLIQQWQSAGGLFTYDSAFSTEIGGYPKGALLMSADGATLWVSSADDNTTDPDGVSPVGWLSMGSVGTTAITGLTNANVTLTGVQASRGVVTLAGTLSGNVQIIFPATQKTVRVFNNTTGAFTVTCKTAAGTGSVVTQGGGETYYGDGVNLVPGRVSTQAPGDNSQKPASTAYVDGSAGLSAGGQCYLSKSGANLSLARKNGNRLYDWVLPATPLTLAPTGATPTTVYYIYAVATAGVATSLERSTTVPVADATTGIMIKTGDDTRRLVGMAYCAAGPAWVDDATTIGVLSYFNRRAKQAVAAMTTNAAVTSVAPTAVEVATSLRAFFLCWADSATRVVFNGGTYNSINVAGNFFIGVDGLAPTDSGGQQYNVNTSPLAAEYLLPPSVNTEGVLHYSTLAAFVISASTQTFIGNAVAAGYRCVNQTTVQG